MKQHHQMIDAMLRDWIAKLDDEALLLSWVDALSDRVAQLAKTREYTREQLRSMYAACQPGQVLFAEKRVRDKSSETGDLLREVAFVSFNREPKTVHDVMSGVLEVRRVDALPAPHNTFRLTVDQAWHHQLLTTPLDVRRKNSRHLVNTGDEA